MKGYRLLTIFRIVDYPGSLNVSFDESRITFGLSKKWLRRKRLLDLRVGQKVYIKGMGGNADAALARPNALADMIRQ